MSEDAQTTRARGTCDMTPIKAFDLVNARVAWCPPRAAMPQRSMEWRKHQKNWVGQKKQTYFFRYKQFGDRIFTWLFLASDTAGSSSFCLHRDQNLRNWQRSHKYPELPQSCPQEVSGFEWPHSWSLSCGTAETWWIPWCWSCPHKQTEWGQPLHQ